jgi:hypothetical protein
MMMIMGTNLAAALERGLFSSPFTRFFVEPIRSKILSLTPLFFKIESTTFDASLLLLLRLTIAANVRQNSCTVLRDGPVVVPRVEGFEGQLDSDERP